MKLLLRFLFTLTIIFFYSGLLAQSTGDFQTAKSGNWNDPAVWQFYSGSAWVSSTVPPDSLVGKITILNGHTVTVTANGNADSLYVESGGALVINSGKVFTIGYNSGKPGLNILGPNGVLVSGTLVNKGNIVAARAAKRTVNNEPAVDTLVIKDGGVYEHALAGGSIPLAKWETGSTCLVTGSSSAAPSFKGQNYYNLVWNTPNLNNYANLNLYRNRIRGNFTVIDEGIAASNDRDIRLTQGSAWSGRDTIWIDGNITLNKPSADGHWSRVAATGSSSGVDMVIVVGGNITVGDSCIIGRCGSGSDAIWKIGGDVTVSAGGSIRNMATTQAYKLRQFIFTKQGTAKLTVTPGRGTEGSANLTGPMEVASGCTLDIGTTVIPNTVAGFFAIDQGGALKVSYGTTSGGIECTGTNAALDKTEEAANTAHGNDFVIAKKVVGTGSITFAAQALQNSSDATKAIKKQWKVTADAGITSANLVIAYSKSDIPSTAKEANFVAMIYSGAGTVWANKGKVQYTQDPLTGEIAYAHADTMKNVTGLSGTWSIGEASLTGVERTSNTIPGEFSVKQNYPNPFNPSTTIEFGIPKASQVSVKIFNLLGQEVATLCNEFKSAGNYKVMFNASSISSGVYLYRIQAGENVEVKRMLLLK